jgi:hypothetical protein
MEACAKTALAVTLVLCVPARAAGLDATVLESPTRTADGSVGAVFGLTMATGIEPEHVSVRFSPLRQPPPFSGDPLTTGTPVTLDGPGELREEPLFFPEAFTSSPHPPCTRGRDYATGGDIHQYEVDLPPNAVTVLRVPATLGAAPPLPGQPYALVFRVGEQLLTTPPAAFPGPVGPVIQLRLHGATPPPTGLGSAVLRTAPGALLTFTGTTQPTLARRRLTVTTTALKSGTQRFPPVWSPPKAQRAGRVRTDSKGRFRFTRLAPARANANVLYGVRFRSRSSKLASNGACGVLVSTGGR